MSVNVIDSNGSDCKYINKINNGITNNNDNNNSLINSV
jgi:hypothetical protein